MKIFNEFFTIELKDVEFKDDLSGDLKNYVTVTATNNFATIVSVSRGSDEYKLEVGVLFNINQTGEHSLTFTIKKELLNIDNDLVVTPTIKWTASRSS